MAYEGRITKFLGQGLAADREATIGIAPDALGLFFATDTGELSAWINGAWVEDILGAGAATASWGGITGTLTDQTDLTGYITAQIAALVDSAPGALDTLNELAAALGDDPNFAASITAAIAGKANAADVDAAVSDLEAAIAALQGGGSGQGAPLNGVVFGCGVAYTSALSFALSAGSYYLDGDLLTAAAQTITLAAADPTNPRIDVLYLDDSGTFGKVTGTPAASPSQPALDPSTQLYLTFVLVPAAATNLNTAITTETIFDEGTDWTATASGSGFTVGSTSNPNTGTVCIEATSLAAGAYVRFVDASPSSFDGDGNLLLSIRSKATWNAKRLLSLRWYASGVAVGSPVTLKQGSFGFESGNTTAYQLLVISKALFAVPAGTVVDELRITASGSGGSAIGFYLDPIKLQTTSTAGGGSGGTISGITQAQADARYLKQTGGTLSGDLSVPDEAYDATAWNNSLEVPTKNAVRDKIEALALGAGTAAWGGITGTLSSQTDLVTYIANQIAAVVASSPAALDTLNELAAALGNDANFATTVTNALAGKLSKSSNLSDLTDAAAARTNLGLVRPIPFFFTTAPTASEVLAIYVSAEAMTLADDFAGSSARVGTNPTSSFVLTVKKNGSSVGTITISTAGAIAFATTGTTVPLAAGDYLTVEAPSTPDATIANVAINLKGTL